MRKGTGRKVSASRTIPFMITPGMTAGAGLRDGAC